MGVPEFDFGSETTWGKTSKDTILAELADLHGNNSPEQPIKKKNSNTDFNIFDQPRSKPTIDPMEVPKEDELDALLQLNTTSKQQQQAKKSNPISRTPLHARVSGFRNLRPQAPGNCAAKVDK